MQLLFPNRSQSLVPKTRATLVQLAKDYGKSSAGVPDLGPLTEETYPDYVYYITGFYPCPVCGGPMGRRSMGEPVEVSVPLKMGSHISFTVRTRERFTPLQCLNYPVHTLIASKHEPDEWERRLGPLCEKHGLYLTECVECLECLKGGTQ